MSLKNVVAPMAPKIHVKQQTNFKKIVITPTWVWCIISDSVNRPGYQNYSVLYSVICV